jgi:hypothetical protein
MQTDPTIIRGRGSVGNPANRFEQFHLERDPDWDPAEDPAPATRFFNDATSSIITYNDSPDVGFEASVNPYRGCEHGCAYCYARPTHEYLGLSAGLDFESKIMVKRNAPQLLRRELSSPRWKPKVLAISGVTDPYQPAERRLKITRGCLQVLAEFRNPVVIVTKNHLVTRDLDFLVELAANQAANVLLSVTTLTAASLNDGTKGIIPNHRLAAISIGCAGVPGRCDGGSSDTRADRSRNARDHYGCRRGRSALCRLRRSSPAARSSSIVRGLADSTRSGQKRKSAGPNPCDPRREIE